MMGIGVGLTGDRGGDILSIASTKIRSYASTAGRVLKIATTD